MVHPHLVRDGLRAECPLRGWSCARVSAPCLILYCMLMRRPIHATSDCCFFCSVISPRGGKRNKKETSASALLLAEYFVSGGSRHDCAPASASVTTKGPHAEGGKVGRSRVRSRQKETHPRFGLHVYVLCKSFCKLRAVLFSSLFVVVFVFFFFLFFSFFLTTFATGYQLRNGLRRRMLFPAIDTSRGGYLALGRRLRRGCIQSIQDNPIWRCRGGMP